MKTVELIVVLVLLSYNGIAQTQVKGDSLSVLKTVAFQDISSYADIDIKFKELISDSRCPKNVTCIRAGEAKILVTVFKNGKFIKDQELIIDASGYLVEELHTFFKTADYNMMVFGLSPYPEGTTPIDKNDYKLKFLIKPSKI